MPVKLRTKYSLIRSLIAAALLFLAWSSAFAAENNLAGIDPVESARREFQNGKLDPALALLEQAEMQSTLAGRGLDLRGCVLLEQGKFDQAISSFTAAREADPTTIARLHEGDAFRRQQKWEEARTAYLTGMKETNILILNERYRFAVFMTYLGARDEENARVACDRLTFPTESAAYYYAQAAWSFAHGSNRDGQKWVKQAEEIFPAKSSAWFARHLYDFGWLKSKPPLSAE